MSVDIHGLGQEWAQAMIRASWQGAVAALVVGLLCLAWRRIPNSLRCGLWWLVGLKLLLGLAPSVFSVPLLPADKPIAQASIPAMAVPDTTYVAASPTVALPSVEAQKPVESDSDPTLALMAVWLVGAIAWGAWSLRPFLRARRLAARSLPVGGGLQDEAEAIHRSMGLRSTPPRVRVTEAPMGVLTVGVVRPTILFSKSILGECSPEEVRMILAHEIAHLRRLDTLTGLVPQVAQIVFFFHPAVWVACREFGLAREALCDEVAVATLRARPEAYGGLLLKFCSHQGGTLCTPGVSSHFRLLRRRITMLESSTRPRRPRRRSVDFICAAIALVLTSASLVEARQQTPSKLEPRTGAASFEPSSKATPLSAPKGSTIYILHKQSATKAAVALRKQFKASSAEISAVVEANALVVPDAVAKQGALQALKQIDATAVPLASKESETTFVMPLKLAKAQDVMKRVSGKLEALGGQFISVDPNTNSLVMVAPAAQVGTLKAYVRQLDSNPPSAPLATPPNVMMVIPLTHATAQSVAKAVASRFALTPGEGIVVNPKTNSLTLVGLPAKLAPIKAYVWQLDGKPSTVVAPKGDQIVVFRLEQANASEAAKQANRAFAGQGVRVSADDYSNSVIISCEMAKVAQVRGFIESLDGKAGPARSIPAKSEPASDGADIQPADSLQIRVFGVKNGSAADMVKLLHQTFGPTTSTLRIAAYLQNSSVVVSASPDKLVAIGDLIRELDRPQPSYSFTKVYKLRYARAEDLEPVVRALASGQSIQVATDKRTNSLVVSTTTYLRDDIDKVVQELDVPGK